MPHTMTVFIYLLNVNSRGERESESERWTTSLEPIRKVWVCPVGGFPVGCHVSRDAAKLHCTKLKLKSLTINSKLITTNYILSIFHKGFLAPLSLVIVLYIQLCTSLYTHFIARILSLAN